MEEISISGVLIGIKGDGGELIPMLLAKSREAAAVGSIRTFADGKNYKKVSSGKWVQVSDSTGGGGTTSASGKRRSGTLTGGRVEHIAYRALAPSTMIQSYGASYAHVQDVDLVLERFLSGNSASRIAMNVMQKTVLIQNMTGGQWFSMLGSSHANSITKRGILLAKRADSSGEGRESIRGDGTYSVDDHIDSVVPDVHRLMDQNGGMGWKKLNKYHWICLFRSDYDVYLHKFTMFSNLGRSDYNHLAKLFMMPKRGDIYYKGKIKKQ